MTEKSRENVVRRISFSFEEDTELNSLYERLKRTYLDNEPSQEFLMPTDLIVKRSDLWNLMRILYLDVEDENSITEENIINNVRKIFQKYLTSGVPIGEAFLPIITYFPEILGNIAENKKSFYLHLIGPTYTGKTFTSLSVISSLLTMYVKIFMDFRSKIHSSKIHKDLKEFFNTTIMPLLETVGVTKDNFNIDKYISNFIENTWQLLATPKAIKLGSIEHLLQPNLDREIIETPEAFFYGVVMPPDRMGVLNDIFIKIPEAFKRFPYLAIFYNSNEKAGLLIFTHIADRGFRKVFMNSYGKVLTSPKFVCERAFSRFGICIPISKLDSSLRESMYLFRVYDAIKTLLDMMVYRNLDWVLSSSEDIIKQNMVPAKVNFTEANIKLVKSALGEILDSILTIKYGTTDDDKSKNKSLRAEEWKNLKEIIDKLLSRSFDEWVNKLELKRADMARRIGLPPEERSNYKFAHLLNSEILNKIVSGVGKDVFSGKISREAIDRAVMYKNKIKNSLDKLNKGLTELFYANAFDTNIRGTISPEHVFDDVKIAEGLDVINKHISNVNDGLFSEDIALKIIKKTLEANGFFDLIGMNKDDFKSLEDFRNLLNKKNEQTVEYLINFENKRSEEGSKTIEGLFQTFSELYKTNVEGKGEYENLFSLIETDIRNLEESPSKFIGNPNALVARAVNRRQICEIIPEGTKENIDILFLPNNVMISKESMLGNYSLAHFINMMNSMREFLSPDAYRSHGKYLLMAMFGVDPIILPALYDYFDLYQEDIL
ncbi:MAG: hypothetical protein QXZ43_04320 [Candidatus Aenigmatarchaeota archaeon]